MREARPSISRCAVPHTDRADGSQGLPIPTSLILVGLMALCVYTKHFDGPGGALGTHGLPGGLIAPLGKSGFDVHWVALIFGGCVDAAA